MAGQESLRAAAARDKDFVGVDIAAMARLIRQMSTASETISAWLRTNGTLPPSVPRTGLRQASAVNAWAGAQSGMLTRRRNYALTHLSRGGHDMPRVGPGRLGGAARRTTSAGAGHDLGGFPDVRAATRAGAADAARIRAAEAGQGTVPDDVWRRLAAGSDDPDYARGLYDRLGPAGAAGLIKAALGDEDRLAAVRASLGVASHHLTMDETWLRKLLDAARRDGVGDDAADLLAHAGLGHRAKVALGHLGLQDLARTATPPPDDTLEHPVTTPRPPYEAMITPAADDPHAAADLYARHPEAIHRALLGAPGSEILERLVAGATASRDADPAAVRENAERLAGFLSSRPTGAPG